MIDVRKIYLAEKWNIPIVYTEDEKLYIKNEEERGHFFSEEKELAHLGKTLTKLGERTKGLEDWASKKNKSLWDKIKDNL